MPSSKNKFQIPKGGFDIWCLKFCIFYLVLGAWFLYFFIWFLVLGSWNFLFGTWDLELGIFTQPTGRVIG